METNKPVDKKPMVDKRFAVLYGLGTFDTLDNLNALFKWARKKTQHKVN